MRQFHYTYITYIYTCRYSLPRYLLEIDSISSIPFVPSSPHKQFSSVHTIGRRHVIYNYLEAQISILAWMNTSIFYLSIYLLLNKPISKSLTKGYWFDIPRVSYSVNDVLKGLYCKWCHANFSSVSPAIGIVTLWGRHYCELLACLIWKYFVSCAINPLPMIQIRFVTTFTNLLLVPCSTVYVR